MEEVGQMGLGLRGSVRKMDEKGGGGELKQLTNRHGEKEEKDMKNPKIRWEGKVGRGGGG